MQKAIDRPPSRLFTSKWQTYQEVVDPDKITFDDILSAKWWEKMNHPDSLQEMDILEVVAMDHSWDARLRLMLKRSGEMKWNILSMKRNEPVEKASPAGKDFKVTHNGFARYSVVEVATGKVIADGLDKAGAENERARLEDTRKRAA